MAVDGTAFFALWPTSRASGAEFRCCSRICCTSRRASSTRRRCTYRMAQQRRLLLDPAALDLASRYVRATFPKAG